MKRFITFLFVIGFVTYSLAQVNNAIPTGQNTGGSGPQIKFTETSHDFGNINEGTYAKYSFKFYNTGDKPLLLKSVNASCGCTAPTWPTKPILPGDSNTISAVFNSRGYGGNNFHKSITVTTNMEKDGVVVLFIKGHVLKVETAPNNPTQSPVQINPR
jgi:hypothetical protein